MKSQKDPSRSREKIRSIPKTNVFDKENLTNELSNAPSTKDLDTLAQGRHGILKSESYGLKLSRKKSPLRASSSMAGIGGNVRVSTASPKMRPKEYRQQQIVTALKTDMDITLDSTGSIDEAMADLHLCVGDITSSFDEGDSNDSSFDSGDVHQAEVNHKYANRLEHKGICRIDNPLAEILLNVDKTPSSALATPNTSPILGNTLPQSKANDESSLDFIEYLQTSLQDDDSHRTVPIQNQLREMSDSLSDVKNISEIASLKRPIPISPSETHETVPNTILHNKKLFLTPPSKVNDTKKSHSC